MALLCGEVGLEHLLGYRVIVYTLAWEDMHSYSIHRTLENSQLHICHSPGPHGCGGVPDLGAPIYARLRLGAWWSW